MAHITYTLEKGNNKIDYHDNGSGIVLVFFYKRGAAHKDDDAYRYRRPRAQENWNEKIAEGFSRVY